jgi:chemotaxis protein methyltransferase CheR
MLATELTEVEFAKFQSLIYRLAGIRIPAAKRVLVSNRLRRRLRATGIASFSAYFAFLTSTAGRSEMPQFLDVITTNETYFFRDPHHYEWVEKSFLPEIAADHRGPLHRRRLRIWSAACATGEELYSIAIKVQVQRRLFSGWKVTLLGTDLSSAALQAAQAAIYDERALHLVPAAQRTLFFEHDAAAQRWTLKPEVKALATWKIHNLLEPLREEPFDCIFLKNVLIYFDPESRQRVVQNLLAAIAKGGYLVVGPTEGVYTMLGSLKKHKTWLYQRVE